MIDCTPGGLRALVGEHTDMTSLTVNGQMDVTDFDFIADRMPDLTTLVIDAEIVPYKGNPTRNGSGVSAPRALPPFALFGSTVKNLTISGNTTTIGEAALAGTNLEKLTVTANISALPPYMAKDVATLHTVILSPSVTEIGASAFEGCTALTAVEASGVTVISDHAFNGCTSLTDYPFTAQLKEIGDYAFSGTSLLTADLQQMKSLKTLGKGAFSECPDLTLATLPEGVTTLPEAFFFGDSSLTRLLLPSTLTGIATLSLAGLTSINPAHEDFISNTAVETIGDYGMANWKSAGTVTLPSTLNYLGDNAMQQWESLESITVKEGMEQAPALGENVWHQTPQENVSLNVSSATLAEEFRSTPQWKEFRVTDMSTDEPIATGSEENGYLNVEFNGNLITVTCDIPMTEVALFDLSGHLIARTAPDATTATLSTGSRDILLLRVTTTDNKTLNRKILRK